MTDPVTNNFSLVLPTVGGDLNIWGGILNNGVITAIDSALGSNFPVTINSSDVTLTASQFQNAIFILSGVLTGNRSLIIPLSPNSGTLACGGRFVVVNNTTGNFTVTVKTAATASTGVTVAQGFTAFLYSDQTNVGYCTLGTPAFALASAGNPNQLLAGTAASVNTNAQFAYDYVNGALYICTVTGTSTTAVWVNPVLASIAAPTPQGYLTPTSNTPIVPTDVPNAAAVYYTPFVGQYTVVHNGTGVVPVRFSQMQLTLTSSQLANNIYDVFLAYNSGSMVIGTGPSWLASGGSITAGSCARGTGAGSTALIRTNGFYVNTVDISLIWNTGSGNTTITVLAGQGIYLGSLSIDATNGQVSCYRQYGQSRKWGIWNAFNRMPIILKAGDSTASWLQGGTTPGPANGLTANSLMVFTGLAEEVTNITYDQTINGQGSDTGICGVGYNVTNAYSGYHGRSIPNNVNGGMSTHAAYDATPALGLQTVTALNSSQTGTNVIFFGTEANCLLAAEWAG